MSYDMEKIAGMTWNEAPLMIFDLETTGFSRNDRIVEFGAVLMEGNRVIETMHHLVNPGKLIPPETTAIHNITNQMVENAPRWKDVARECFDFLFGRRLPIVSHNMSFDARMLAQQVDPSRWPSGIYTLCTMTEARKLGHKGKAKLTALADHYNLEYDNEHAALSDSIVTGMLARRFAGSYIVSDHYTKMSEEWAAALIDR